jgi:hypothetical protein
MKYEGHLPSFSTIFLVRERKLIEGGTEVGRIAKDERGKD